MPSLPISASTQKQALGRRSFDSIRCMRNGSVTLRFKEFDFSDAQMGNMMEGKEFELRAIVNIIDGKKTTPVTLVMKQGPGGMVFPPVSYVASDGREHTIRLERVKPNTEDDSQSVVQVDVKVPAAPGATPKGETLLVEASIKPFINLVWVGTITLVIGFFVTIVRRVTESQKPS